MDVQAEEELRRLVAVAIADPGPPERWNAVDDIVAFVDHLVVGATEQADAMARWLEALRNG